MEGVVFIVLVALFYFVPMFVSASRNHPQRNAIAVLNLLLGWTFIGWAVALVWAMTGPSVTKKTPDWIAEEARQTGLMGDPDK